ncbi:hypothetical protein THF5H11_50189 [Vibrio jasicida]|uniref:Transposase n=1 Tax=Vibrio jasicida TaxID=766224 RepID=A0AAU9QQB0_9VIBR|nr:hypothetical protein THF5H11_50189 [Vibrio jasicida]CAH1595461.1 hypothetical protein THF1A12_30124 [Vibrio jasicida]CAH1600371.1 hypothetical protein THF1C08_60111 [Vibrio jasicida]CAH1608866.1 hypothetical protein THF5G08_70195 [Vibrio jasicida]
MTLVNLLNYFYAHKMGKHIYYSILCGILAYYRYASKLERHELNLLGSSPFP